MSGFFMHRFFSEQPLLDTVSLGDGNPLFHQICHVFRAKKWQKVIFFESAGPDIIYEVIDIGKKNTSLRIVETLPLNHRKQVPITLFQAYPNKLSTLEYLVQKNVEIGIHQLVLFPSDHSQMRSIPPSKLSRISSIAQEAMEQSGQNIPLVIREYKTQKEVFMSHSELTHIVGHQKWLKKPPELSGKSIWLWVGPEGGWSPQEESFFQENTMSLWSFNENILRLETAGVVGTGILSYLFPL